jgi:alkanesulfonate monooxygenase SsuD/methylene tetrahydromethanopterin reductase-like flavin-dependent oxidoreductase (luciferase family)
VHHHGQHITVVDDVYFLPQPMQQPGVPIWVAGFPGKLQPLRRAARYNGYFPVNLEHPDQLAEMVATITNLRTNPTTPYDFAVALPPDTDPTPYEAAGATWRLVEFDPEALRLTEVRAVLRAGPIS